MELTDGLNLVERIAAALGALIPLATAWVSMRRGWLSISVRRTDRLFQLLSTGDWRRVEGAALQLAAEQAFGIHLDDEEIRWALERHDPIGLLRSRVLAAHLVRWERNAREYRDNRLIKRIPLVSLRRLYGVLLALSFVFLLAFTFWAGQESLMFAAIACVEGLFFVWLLATAYREVRAAQKLLDPREHPVVARTECQSLPSM